MECAFRPQVSNRRETTRITEKIMMYQRSPRVSAISTSTMRIVSQHLRFKSRGRGSEVDPQHVNDRFDLVRRHVLQEVVDQILLAGLADRRPVHDE